PDGPYHDPHARWAPPRGAGRPPCGPARGSATVPVRLAAAGIRDPGPSGRAGRGRDHRMKVTWLPDAEPRPRRVAVGTFDGVHLGHREVIRGADTVLTFDPHPSAIVSPHGAPPLLTPFERKKELIATLGVEELVVIPFDREFAQRSAQAFVDEIIVSQLGATHVSVGENFRFGNRAQGDPELLASDGRVEVRVVELLEIDGEVVS